MNPFEMVVLIVAIVMIASVLRRGRNRLGPGQGADSEALHAEVARLKDRVEVLERIATDGSRRLSDEIEDLRR